MRDREEFRLDEISIFGIIRSILANIWVIILAMAAAWLIITGVSHALWTPVYTSSAVMAVSSRGNGSDAYTSLSLTNQMAGIFSEVFSSNVLKEKIAEELGVSEINAEISASIIEETNLIQLQVTAENPRQAYMVLQAAIENYDSVSDYLFSNAVLRMVQSPNIPFGPSNPLSIDRVRKLAMAGAAAVVCGFIVLFAVLRFTVQTRSGARRNLDGRILETIPFERKHKTLKDFLKARRKSILISAPVVGTAYVEAVGKLAAQLEHHMRKREQKILVVTSISENEGKSSLAANLALSMEERGRKVLLIDSDLKKPALYKIFDRKDEKLIGLMDYLDGRECIESIVKHVTDSKDSLSVIYQQNGVKDSSKFLDSPKMKNLLEKMKEEYDYVILDSAPMAVSSDAEFLFKNADAAVIVVRQDRADVRAINGGADSIREAGIDMIGFVPNAFRDGLGSGARSRYHYYGYGRYSSEGKGE